MTAFKIKKKGCKSCGNRLYKYTKDCSQFLCIMCYETDGNITTKERFEEAVSSQTIPNWLNKFKRK